MRDSISPEKPHHFLAAIQPIFPRLSAKQDNPLDKAWVITQGIEDVLSAVSLSTSTTRVPKYLALSVHGTFSWSFLCSGVRGAECSIKSLSVYS
jgi:hypothetical protein